MSWPTFKVKKSGGRVAVNPAHVTAVYENSRGETEIFTLDCARDTDAWDVEETFDEVTERLR